MSSINSHYYLVGHATNGENPEAVYMKPTAENIANFIMKHRDSEVTITDELDIPFVTAFNGFINTCKDQNFLITELHPAIIPIQRGEKEVGEIDKYPMGENEYEDEMFD